MHHRNILKKFPYYYRESLRRVLGQGKKISRHDPEKKKISRVCPKKFFKKINSSMTQAFWRICLKNGTFFFAKDPMGHELKLILVNNGLPTVQLNKI